MGSFVENVNKLSLNLDTIVKASSTFDYSVLPILQEVADLDLQEVTEDFKKGNYLGNRKIDVDLSLNKLTSASIVSYSRADITLVSGSIVSIPFLSGSSVLELTSHNDIKNYIVNDALWAGIEYTECTVEEATDTTPTLIRFRDADGHSSNVERVELTVYSGTAKDIKPVYFWAQTTSALQTIANRVGDIIALGNNINNVIELSQHIDELNELQAELTSILAIHANLAEILLADTNAGIATTKAAEALASKTSALQALSDATAQAVIATNQAIIATTKSNEIKSITTQTTTGAAGSLAQVSYNSTDGKLSFVIPQGLKGDRGEAFSVNAMGTFAQRTGYDAQPINFSYFATDMSLIYFKQSATSGDWSVGIPWGKGDKGDTGLTGNGISTIAKISGTGAAGSADTYRITYTNGGTFDFTVWNGTESVISVAGKSGTVALVKADVGLSNVDNTSDVNKPVSTAQAAAIGLKANDNKSIFIGTTSLTLNRASASQTLSGISIDGNAGTATKLAATKTINGVAFDGSDNITVVDSTKVALTGNQTIADVKTFTSSPIVPTPTTDTQVANKQYVDSKAEGAWVANDTRAKTSLNASGTAPIYACRAWVNFNGTGTVAIRASGNVSSITDRGTGMYTVNLITALPDANGSAHTGTALNDATSNANGVGTGPVRIISTTQVNVGTGNTAGPADEDVIYCSVFR